MLTLTLVKGGQNERLGIEVEIVSWEEAIHQQGDRFAVRRILVVSDQTIVAAANRHSARRVVWRIDETFFAIIGGEGRTSAGTVQKIV